MLELVELPGFERRKPTQISGGQAQRVALARALINRPAVLLLDEPLGALDLKLRKQMQVELKRIQQEVGITFIYVTHDQEEAMTMSDRIAVMNKGRYEQLGDPETLYERPTTRFVAGFLGRQQPAAAARARAPTAATATSASRDDTMVRAPARAVYGRDRGRRRRPAREDPPPSRRRSDAPAGHNHLSGVVRTPRTWASAPSTSSRPTAAPGRGVRAERRTHNEGRAVGSRGPGAPDLVAGSHVRRRRSGAPAVEEAVA